MKREEAITYLKVIWNRYKAEYEIERETLDAYHMAISALKDEPLSHEEAWAEIETKHGRLIDADTLLDEFEEYCDMEKCENCPFVEDKVYCGVRAKIIDAPTIEPDGDLISRADAIEAIQNAYCKPCKERGDDHNEVRCRACDFDDAIIQIDALPLADRPRGEWICKDTNDMSIFWFECSVCGEEPPKDKFCHEYKSNYCPNCGARMVTE